MRIGKVAKFRKVRTRAKFYCYICHWCKLYSSLRKKWTWKHEDKCLDDPIFTQHLLHLNGLRKNE